jgi:hypothetical protein
MMSSAVIVSVVSFTSTREWPDEGFCTLQVTIWLSNPRAVTMSKWQSA